MLARHDLESLLRQHRLDHTLRHAPADREPADAGRSRTISTGLPALDRRLDGGFPRGQLSEIVGARSTGRTGVLCAMLAAATRNGELVALVDTSDVFDPVSAVASGIRLPRLLWIRGARGEAAVRGALKATALLLQSGDFGGVVLDLADVPVRALRRVPFTTWKRLQRLVEGGRTACVLIGSRPLARGPSGVTLELRASGAGGRWIGTAVHRMLDGLTVRSRIVRPWKPDVPASADDTTVDASGRTTTELLLDAPRIDRGGPLS